MTSTSRRPSRLAWTVTLVIAVLAVVTVARLLVVSGYQVPTATAVARSQGVVATVVGAVLPPLGAVLPPAAVLLIAAAVVALALGSRFRAGLAVAAAGTVVVALLVSPAEVTLDEAVRGLQDPGNAGVAVLAWGDWLPVGVVVAVVVVVGLVRRDTVPGFRLGRYLVLSAVGTAAVLLFALVAHDAYRPVDRLGGLPDTAARMWLPAERIVASGQRPRIGYVLSADARWTTVLWDSDRGVALLASDRVTGRSVCRVGPDDGLPLLAGSTRQLAVAMCPVAPAPQR